jgi:hypothetical protein
MDRDKVEEALLIIFQEIGCPHHTKEPVDKPVLCGGCPLWGKRGDEIYASCSLANASDQILGRAHFG